MIKASQRGRSRDRLHLTLWDPHRSLPQMWGLPPEVPKRGPRTLPSSLSLRTKLLPSLSQALLRVSHSQGENAIHGQCDFSNTFCFFNSSSQKSQMRTVWRAGLLPPIPASHPFLPGQTLARGVRRDSDNKREGTGHAASTVSGPKVLGMGEPQYHVGSVWEMPTRGRTPQHLLL